MVHPSSEDRGDERTDELRVRGVTVGERLREAEYGFERPLSLVYQPGTPALVRRSHRVLSDAVVEPVVELIELLDVEYSKLSYHLKILREAGLVIADREGNYVTYRPTDRGEDVIEIVLDLCSA